MFEKLEKLLARYLELEKLISDPDVIARQDEWKKLSKEHASIEETVQKYLEYKKAQADFEDIKALSVAESDHDMKEMYHEEAKGLEARLSEYTEELKIMLLPKNPDDSKNVILEIRAGAGGDEAALFGAELLRMYLKYAERKRWKTEEMESNITELGGVKEVVYNVCGRDVYSRLKYESGVHRVQRVPETESQGRVHTSTVTVAVLPEAEDVEIEVDEKDLRVDIFRSSGAGGQKVNKTDSAIRITHLPTGLVVTCQDERSQIKNREKAMKVLKSRLLDMYQSKADAEYAEARKLQVGTGDRSERIRTYNFPQGRVSDHRINKTVYTLDAFMLGDLDEMIDALALADRDARLGSAE